MKRLEAEQATRGKMTVTIEKMIEVGVFIVANLISLWVAIGLFLNAKAHERSVHSFDAKIEQAGINLRRG